MDGVKVMAAPAQVTVPLTLPKALLRVKVVELMLATCMASLKVAVITVLKATFVALATGPVEATVGATVSVVDALEPLLLPPPPPQPT
jgi:hypothetical protein